MTFWARRRVSSSFFVIWIDIYMIDWRRLPRIVHSCKFWVINGCRCVSSGSHSWVRTRVACFVSGGGKGSRGWWWVKTAIFVLLAFLQREEPIDRYTRRGTWIVLKRSQRRRLLIPRLKRPALGGGRRWGHGVIIPLLYSFAERKEGLPRNQLLKSLALETENFLWSKLSTSVLNLQFKVETAILHEYHG